MDRDQLASSSEAIYPGSTMFCEKKEREISGLNRTRIAEHEQTVYAKSTKRLNNEYTVNKYPDRTY